MLYALTLAPIEAERTAQEVTCLIDQLTCRTCSTTEQKAIIHCFCEGCERSSKGYAGVEKSRVIVAPNHNYPTCTDLYHSIITLLLPTFNLYPLTIILLKHIHLIQWKQLHSALISTSNQTISHKENFQHHQIPNLKLQTSFFTCPLLLLQRNS